MATKKQNKRRAVRALRRRLNEAREAPNCSNRRLLRHGYGAGAKASDIEADTYFREEATAYPIDQDFEQG